MPFKLLLASTVVVLVMTACGSNPIVATYTQPNDEQAAQDWFPIPKDAPAVVEFVEVVVPQNDPYTAPPKEVSEASELVVVQVKDSIGNMSLRFNRTPSTTWELIDAALTDLAFEVKDKDRSEYRFYLKARVKSGWVNGLLQKKEEQLNIALMPYDTTTLVVVEGEGDEMPSTKNIEAIITDLYQYFNKER